MSYRDSAVMALLCTAIAHSGCATKLDFDQVSAGRHSTDGGASLADANGVAIAADAAATDAARVLDASPSAANDAAADPRGDAAFPADTLGHQDSGVPADDPTLFSCANVSASVLFCDDFETFAPADHWTDVLIQPEMPLVGGSVQIDNSVSRAGQDSLSVQINEGVSVCDNCPLYAVVSLALPGHQLGTKLTVEFDLRVDQIDPAIGRRIFLAQLFSGSLTDGFIQHTVQLESRGGSVRIGFVEIDTEVKSASTMDAVTTPYEHGFVPTASLAQWAHVKYVLQIENPTGLGNFATLSVDDTVLFDGSLQNPLRATPVRLEIGVPEVDISLFAAQETSKSWRVRYDNVLVRREPR